MEEQFKNIDKLTKKLVKEAGIHKPSANFLNNVMSVVEQKSIKRVYEPLISRSAWIVIGVLFVASLILLYFYSSSQFILFNDLHLSQKLNFYNPFSAIKFSKTTVYAISFLGLFLIQIPFLKRLMEQRYL
jgi:hypothetical protein